jgi:hypothetical protein
LSALVGYPPVPTRETTVASRLPSSVTEDFLEGSTATRIDVMMRLPAIMDPANPVPPSPESLHVTGHPVTNVL